jgi:hypothetical protein
MCGWTLARACSIRDAIYHGHLGGAGLSIKPRFRFAYADQNERDYRRSRLR